MIKYRNWLRVFAGMLIVAGLLSAIMPVSAAGATTNTAPKPQDISQSVTQSYNADSSVQLGMIVKLKDKDSATVEPLINDNVNQILGVVVPADASTATLTPESIKKQQVFVASKAHFKCS